MVGRTAAVVQAVAQRAVAAAAEEVKAAVQLEVEVAHSVGKYTLDNAVAERVVAASVAQQAADSSAADKKEAPTEDSLETVAVTEAAKAYTSASKSSPISSQRMGSPPGHRTSCSAGHACRSRCHCTSPTPS